MQYIRTTLWASTIDVNTAWLELRVTQIPSMEIDLESFIEIASLHPQRRSK